MIADAAPVTAWRWNDYLLLPAQRRLLHCGEPVEQDDRVFDLLVLLLQNRERAVERQEIITAIWGRRPVGDATLRQLVYKARRAVGDDGVHQTTIHTLYGRSLQWVAPVDVAFAEPQSLVLVPAAPEAAIPEPAPDGALVPPALPAVRIMATAVQNAARLRRRKSDAMSRRMLVGAFIVVAVVALIAGGARVGTIGGRRAVREASRTSRVVPAASTSGQVTIAVLPLLGMGAQPSERYLADGITEELINRLGRFPKLRVAARTSSFVFRDEPVDIRAAARGLGVAYVLEGSLQSSGDRLRVRVQLVNAKDGYELWSDEYNPAVGDVLKVEDEIATAVLKELHPELNPHELAVLDAMPARARVDPAARDYYLVGLEYLNRRTAPDMQQALLYFKRAIQADSGYASAWSGEASAYALLRDYDSDNPPDTHYADALNAASKAVALDPQLARAHAVLALLHEEYWQWAQARQEFQRALQLDPSDAVARQWYALYQWYMQDPQTALAQMRIAHDLDPLSPIVNTDLGRALLFNGQVDAGIAQYQTTLKLDPNFALCHLLLTQAYMAKNRHADALRESRTAVSLTSNPHPSSYLAVLGVAMSLAGDDAGARQQLRILESRSRQHYVSGVSLALLQAQLGESDQVFANLARAVTDHDPLMRPAVVARDSPWHGDPRFNVLLVRMGLPTKY